MRLKPIASVLVVISTLFLTACETMMSSDRVVVSAAERWALLPIENLSSTPLAGNQARSLVETHPVKRLAICLPKYALSNRRATATHDSPRCCQRASPRFQTQIQNQQHHRRYPSPPLALRSLHQMQKHRVKLSRNNSANDSAHAALSGLNSRIPYWNPNR